MLNITFLGPGEIFAKVDHLIRQPRVRSEIAVAYLKQSGLAHVEASLRRARGKVVVGASGFHVTDWQALGSLLRLSEVNPRLLIRRYYNEAFHPKVFYFENGHIATAIVGSSNLTAGGFGSNVEANVMVEGPSRDAFFGDVRKFVRKIFNSGKPLDGKFLKQYRKEYQLDRLTRRRFDSELLRTPLPTQTSPRATESKKLNVPNAATWWKIAPGRKGEDWPMWKKHIDSNDRGYVAIGWKNIGDVSHALSGSEEKLYSFIMKHSRKYYDGSPKYISRQFWTFAKCVKKGDMVVAYSNRTIFGIAQIEGGYRYRPQEDEWYPNLRSVQWHAILGIRPPKRIITAIATNDTIHPIEQKAAVSYLRSLLQKQ